MIRIVLEGSFDETVSQDLVELQDKLSENGFSVSSSSITVPGVKVDLVTGLAIASLTMSTISTLISVINFWKGQKSTSYRISFETRTGMVPMDSGASPAVVDAVENDRITGIKVEKI